MATDAVEHDGRMPLQAAELTLLRTSQTTRIIEWIKGSTRLPRFKAGLAGLDPESQTAGFVIRSMVLQCLDPFPEEPGEDLGLHVALIEIALCIVDWRRVVAEIAA